MKKIILTALFACACVLPLAARETLKVQTLTDLGCLQSGSPQEVVVKIDLLAGQYDPKPLYMSAVFPPKQTPINLAVVIDRSGSMEGPKIEKARQAAMMAVDRLKPGDIFSLVAYDSTVDVLVPAQPVEDKEAIKRQIARIRPKGSTALYAGVEAGAREIEVYLSSKRINRILLLSDGLANVGPSSPEQLRHLGHRLAGRGISVSTIGVGDDYNEDLMSGIAEASDANYYYVKDVETLPEIFAKELGALAHVAVRKIRIEVECPDGVEPLGFIGRTESFQNHRAMVELDSLTAGQERYVLLRCRAQEKRKVSGREIARVTVSYVDEFDDGRECHCADTARVDFDPDASIARASGNATVIAQRELMLNALKIDEALLEADAGRLGSAADKLASQAARLREQARIAPAAMRSQLNSEVQNLDDRAQQFKQGQYDSGSRKSMQSESWNYRNSKIQP